MSHSDSEIRDVDNEKRKKLGTLFKAKLRCRLQTNNELKSRALKHQIGPILLEFKLLAAVSTNNVEEVQRLLSRGVSANTTDVQKRSALHIAVTRSFKEVVRLLLQYGADPNKRDTIQNTPLHLAACTHNFAIISLLLDAGADVYSLDMHGRHPLQLARSKLQILQKSWMHGHIEIIKLKEEMKDVINLMISMKNAKGRSPSTSANALERDLMQLTINNLENIKLNMNSTENNNMEDQMSQLLAGLQNFQIG